MARWPEAMRTGRSIQLRRTMRSVLRSMSFCRFDRPIRNRFSRTGTGSPAIGVPRAASSFLNWSRPTSRMLRPRLARAGGEGELDRVRGRQGRIAVAADEQVQHHAGIGDLDDGAHGRLERLALPGIDPFEAPDHPSRTRPWAAAGFAASSS